MNNSMVRRMGVALLLFAGLSFSLEDGVAAHEEARSGLLSPYVICIGNQAEITPFPAEEVALEFAGNGLQGVFFGNWSHRSDGALADYLRNEVGVSPLRNARGLAPPLMASH